MDRLKAELRAAGVQVWIDRDGLRAGERWAPGIEQAIEGLAFFIACLSQNFWRRDRTYMNRELAFAAEEVSNRHPGCQWLLPVKLNDCALPTHRISRYETIEDLHCVDLYDDWTKGVEQLLCVVHPVDKVLSAIKADDIPRTSELCVALDLSELPFDQQKRLLDALIGVLYEQLHAGVETITLLRFMEELVRVCFGLGTLEAVESSGHRRIYDKELGRMRTVSNAVEAVYVIDKGFRAYTRHYADVLFRLAACFGEAGDHRSEVDTYRRVGSLFSHIPGGDVARTAACGYYNAIESGSQTVCQLSELTDIFSEYSDAFAGCEKAEEQHRLAMAENTVVCRKIKTLPCSEATSLCDEMIDRFVTRPHTREQSGVAA